MQSFHLQDLERSSWSAMGRIHQLFARARIAPEPPGIFLQASAADRLFGNSRICRHLYRSRSIHMREPTATGSLCANIPIATVATTCSYLHGPRSGKKAAAANLTR